MRCKWYNAKWNRDLSVCQIGVRAFTEANSLTLPPTAQWGSLEPLELNYKGRWTTRTELRLFGRSCSSPTWYPDIAVCQFAKSRFEHLGASSLALPPTAQWGSEEPLESDYKGRWTARTSPRPFERGCSSPTWHTDNESWKIYSSAMRITTLTMNGKRNGEKESFISFQVK